MYKISCYNELFFIIIIILALVKAYLVIQLQVQLMNQFGIFTFYVIVLTALQKYRCISQYPSVKYTFYIWLINNNEKPTKHITNYLLKCAWKNVNEIHLRTCKILLNFQGGVVLPIHWSWGTNLLVVAHFNSLLKLVLKSIKKLE